MNEIKKSIVEKIIAIYNGQKVTFTKEEADHIVEEAKAARTGAAK